tara:strand:- start:728 stop:1096 length:369 start_codon:yes stop_codon:yes gene_type:complete
MDACYKDRDETNLTPEQNYNATYLVTVMEVTKLCKEFKLINQRCLRKKQKSFYRYFEPVQVWISGFPESIEDSPEETLRFFKGLVKIVEDAHTILNEETNQKLRDQIIQNAYLRFAEPAGSA